MKKLIIDNKSKTAAIYLDETRYWHTEYTNIDIQDDIIYIDSKHGFMEINKKSFDIIEHKK
jgi:hypothetical protein